ncbi:MAG: L,D-transpeptidase family protein [Solirubrobacteraceae bacterium]
MRGLRSLTEPRSARRLAIAAAVVVTSMAMSSPRAAAAPGPIRFPILAGTAAVGSAPAQIAAPSPRGGATLAGIVVAAEARSRPNGGRRIWRAGTATSWSAEPQVLLVLGSAQDNGREWLRVLLPIRPDGSTGWIPRDNVVLLLTRYWITVDKRARTVTIDRNGRRVHRFAAVIGKPATPTPDGLAAIYERDLQPDPQGFLGPWALPLTIFSNVLFDFGGGPGRVAIHGRGGASLNDPLGSAQSHGCIRIDNNSIDWMAANIPQGTPVTITG